MGMDLAPPTGAHGLTSAKLEQRLPKEMQWEPQKPSQICSSHVKKVKRKGEMNLNNIFHLTPRTQILGFPGDSVGSIPGLRRSPGGGHGNPLPVFLPGEAHGQRSLADYSPWGHKESDTTE